MHGYVALAKDAFDSKLSVFTLVDERLRIGDAPGPKSLPATAEDIPAAGRARVMIAGKDGKTLTEPLEGELGLKPGAEVFVIGTVETVGGEAGLAVRAKLIHVPRGPLLPKFFVDEEPAGAIDVSQARAAETLKIGESVSLRGRIGGSKDPFVAGRAVLTLMGRGLKPCNENPGDLCKVPWDYCCETQDSIVANSVTVQVVDEKGRPLRTDLKGRRGMKELTELVVLGTVASTKGGAVVVTAKQMHVAVAQPD